MASSECRERTCTNFRRLLVNHQGPLYEDEHVVLELAVSSRSDKAQPDLCSFEVSVQSRSRQSLHQVSLYPVDMGTSCALSIKMQKEQPTYSGKQGTEKNLSASRRSLRFSGLLEIRGPIEVVPQVELSYLFPDNTSCQARFRLPLTLARFLHPVQMTPPSFLNLWSSLDQMNVEVAFVCAVRRVFLESGGLFLLGKCLELGGCLKPLLGVDDSSQGFVLVSSYPQGGTSNSMNVIVRVELGGPRGENHICRVSVRSVSYLVNRGLANVFIDMLCDSAPPPVAAA